METLTDKKLMEHGWIQGKRRDGDVDWLYPGDMVPRTLIEAKEITRHAYPERYSPPHNPQPKE